MIQENKIASLIYNTLLKYHKLQGTNLFGPIWRYFWNKSINWHSGAVTANVHGRRVFTNNGHSYPLFARRFPHWNNPLIQLVHESAITLGKPIIVVDIGAGIGDTVLLLESNCPSSIKQFVCIEGDTEFFRYLKENLKQPERYELCNVMLSNEESGIPSLVRTHAGTASAQGTSQTYALSFDQLACSHEPPNVIKIDVDGYDGKVLAGATKTLKEHKPAVIFEWDPSLCRDTSNNWLEHFEILGKADYTRYIWFTKYGDFSHFMTDVDINAVSKLAEVCLSGERDYNWHYDVIALHKTSPISDTNLAFLKFAKRRRSWF
ncbi:FkbM family methyltransferase [Methylocaldum sp.]|uniref:FkbM family methyltransferase n=1 Tax=Methylocaldum sp. TaxID=1969727 RepID=UPI002D5FAB31|nr:FkbM family methyltransferase [Methylocaldum sp.]HYE37876.1 FkbM family methyltransferase [Methylocaldum sp.]